MPRKAKTNNEETTRQGHEFDHTTSSAPQNETLRTTTNRTGTGQDEPNRPEHSVAGKNETNRTGKTKRTVPEQSEPQGHESSYTESPQSSRRPKRTKLERPWTGQADPNSSEPGRTDIKFDRMPQSVREALMTQVENAQAPLGSGKNPAKPRNQSQQIQLAANEGPTAEILSASLELFNLPRINVHDEAEVRERLGEYFEVYARRGLKPTVAGLGIALGLDRRRLWEINSGAKSTNDSVRLMPPEVKGLVKGAYAVMESLWESYTVSGKLNPVTSIFLGKNHYGYVDRMDHVVAPGAEEQVRSTEEIRRNYLPSGTEVETEFE